jgi:hypothetical protein
VTRIGVAGEEVDVHPDDVKRFAAANGIIEVAAAPQKRAAPKRK